MDHGTLVIAVGGPSAREVCAMAVPLARARAGTVHVLHVVERTIVTGEDAIDIESTSTATELLDACVTELEQAGVPVFGEVLHTVGTHAAVRRPRVETGEQATQSSRDRPVPDPSRAAGAIAHLAGVAERFIGVPSQGQARLSLPSIL
jgi:hypothetical protein